VTSYATVQIAVGPLASWTTDYVLLDSSAWSVGAGSSSLKMVMPMGELYFNDNAVATTITTADTWTLLGVTTTNDSDSAYFDSPQAGRLRYIGTSARTFHCGATVSMSGAGANDIFQMIMYRDGAVNGNNEFTSGTAITSGLVEVKLGAAGDVASTALHCFVHLSQNSYLEVAIKDVGGTDDFTVKHMNLFAVGSPSAH